MDVFFKTENGSEFCIELGYWDTVLEIKQKIEKYQRIPVSMQTIFFQGKVLQDDLDIEQCVILHNSRIQLYISSPVNNGRNPNHSNGQLLQTENSPPSNSTEDIINGHQDSTVTVQVSRPEQSPPSNSTEDIINGHQDSTGTVQVSQPEQSPPSNSTEDIINGHQDSTVTVQVPQPEQSPPSNSVKEITNNQDLAMNSQSNRIVGKQMIRVLVLPYSGESKVAMNIRVLVNTKHPVKILRNELLQRQLRGHLNPQDGYFFVHKGRILNEDKSFGWNSVGHNDTVEIVLDP